MSQQTAQFIVSVMFAMLAILILASQQWVYKFWPMKKIAAEWMKVWIEDRLRRDRAAVDRFYRSIDPIGTYCYYHVYEKGRGTYLPSKRAERMMERQLMTHVVKWLHDTPPHPSTTLYNLQYLERANLITQIPRELSERMVKTSILREPADGCAMDLAIYFWGKDVIPHEMLTLLVINGHRENLIEEGVPIPDDLQVASSGVGSGA